ncbi:acyltransferase [Methylocystis echinoides]|uniref:acyltransferase family protein n=1 Tax=Methylocystis echinoides TaxID=29468 RepID=UPI003423ECB0
MTRQDIATLTSLRFFAAAMVVIGHSNGTFGLPQEWTRLFPSYQGVSFFFVLSGFILTLRYPRLKSFEESRRFLVARFARIWPLHAVAFFSLFWALDWVPHYLSTPEGSAAAVLNLSLLQAWSPYTCYNMSYNAVSWSISVEAFFYVAFIGLVQLRDRHWRLLPIVGLVPAIALIWLANSLNLPVVDRHSASLDTVLYVNPLARLFEFTLGMSAAVLFERFSPMAPKGLFLGTGLELAGVALFGLSLTLNTEFYIKHYPGHLLPASLGFWLERSGEAPIFAVIIMIFAAQKGVLSRVLSQRLYVVAGEISFAIYMLHQIIQSYILRSSGLPHSMAFALFILLTIWLSYLAWRYIETPARSAILAWSRGEGCAAIVSNRAGASDGADARRKRRDDGSVEIGC